MKSEIQEVVQRIELAERVVLRLREALRQLAEASPDSEEHQWLAVAEQRLCSCAIAARERLEEGIALPELKAVRLEREKCLEPEWLSTVLDLFSELVKQVGENSPLIEALFPHQRFDKLERGGAVQRQYRAQFEVRRASTYVRRLAADPEYPFLAPLLARLDPVSETLTALAKADDLGDDSLQILRDAILQAGEALLRSLKQARALAEAALIDRPDLLAALQLDERPKKRSASPVAEQPAD